MVSLRLQKGINDLETLFPDIAKEADGWDTKEFVGGSHKKMPWKCQKGHKWKAVINSRCYAGKSGCPFCAFQALLVGFNDLNTLFPDIGKEADGWDPSTVISGSHKKMPWKCVKGHKWNASITPRTSLRDKTGCPYCAEFGYNPGKSAWFYLLKRKDEQQFGITNNFSQRMRFHSKFGWEVIEQTGPHSGQEVLDTETALKQWLKNHVGVVSGKTENWYTSKMEVHSLAELKEKSGIKTSIF